MMKAVLPALALMLVMAGFHVHVLRDIDSRGSELLSQLDVVCSSKANDLSLAVGRVLQAGEMIGAWSRLSDLTPAGFKAAAMNTLDAFPEVEGVALAPGGTITMVYPQERHGSVLGKKLLDDPLRLFASRESLRNRMGIVFGPVVAESGNTVFIGQVPLYRDTGREGDFWGFSTSVATLKEVLERAGFTGLREKGFDYRIEKPGTVSDKTEYVAGSRQLPPGRVTRPIEVSGLRLMLSMSHAAPPPGIADHLPGYAAVLLLAVTLAVLLAMATAYPRGLKQRLAARTDRLVRMAGRLAEEIKRSRGLEAGLEALDGLKRGMFENSPAVALVIDPMELEVVDANPAAERFLGMVREQLAGVSLAGFLGVDENELGRKVALCMRGQLETLPVRLRLPGERVRDVEILIGPALAGDRPLLLGVLQDVTGRELARQELSANRGRLKSMVDALDCAIIEVDSEGFIRFVNEGFTRMFGHPRENAVGMPFLVVCPQDELGPCWDLRARLLEGRLERLCERKRFIRKNGGEFWGSACVSPLREAETGVIVGCVAAITDVSDLMEAKRAAEEASGAKSRFLANVSHEFRSPLNAIMGQAELILRQAPQDGPRAGLEKILEAGRALLRVVDGVLDSSSLDSGRITLARTPFDPRDVLGSVAGRYAQEASAKGLDFSVDIPADLPGLLQGDPVRLEQVLANLADNAVKCTDSGRVRVTAALESIGGGSALLRFRVEDTGRGMDPARLAELEQPFAQAESGLDRPVRGAGLGLYITSKLLSLMGTRLKVESAPGEGTAMSFAVSFPVGEVPAPGVSRDGDGLRELTQGLEGKKVLVVDDNPLGLHTAVEMLKLGGVDSRGVSGGEEALGELAGGGYDAVLLDIQMPGMDGFETFRRIRELGAAGDLPVIAVTGHAREEDRILCFEAGMDNHLSKPCSPESLFGVLRQHLIRDKAREHDSRVLDMEGALSLLMGNRRLYVRLLTGFVEEYSQAGRDMRRLAGEGQRVLAGELAHSLKGLASNLGGVRLRAVCLELENFFSSGSEACPPGLLDSFSDELDAFIQAASQARLHVGDES